MAESARKSKPIRERLPEVQWRLPSTPPDTSDLDADWSDVVPPRTSLIMLKPVRPAPHLPEPPSLRRGSSAPPRALSSLPPALAMTTELLHDVWDGPTAMLVMVELPGVEPEQLSLRLGSHALYLDVEVPIGLNRPGLAPGHHELCVELPIGLAGDALDAALSNGLLRVRISKAQAGPRRLQISSAE